MWNPVESWRQRRARQRYMPRARTARSGTTAKVAIAALLLILAASALLELRGGGEGGGLARHVAEAGMDPLDLVERAGRSRRLVLLADITGSSATKRFAADAIERLARTSRLDVLALEIDAEEQRVVDAYLNGPQEDASLLISRPRLLREHEGTGQAWLEIFRRVRRLNDELGADRKIRIMALDSAGWPPARALPPHELARRYGARDAQMQAVIAGVMQREPRARVLILVDGLHVLRGGTSGLVQTGGTRTVSVSWLASALEQQFPQDVFAILVDAPGGTAAPAVVGYRGTTAGPVLEQQGAPRGRAVLLGQPFAFSRQPVRVAATPGMRFELQPHTFTLPQVADGYVFLGD